MTLGVSAKNLWDGIPGLVKSHVFHELERSTIFFHGKIPHNFYGGSFQFVMWLFTRGYPVIKTWRLWWSNVAMEMMEIASHLYGTWSPHRPDPNLGVFLKMRPSHIKNNKSTIGFAMKYGFILYIIDFGWFWGLPFETNPRVIPCPDMSQNYESNNSISLWMIMIYIHG